MLLINDKPDIQRAIIDKTIGATGFFVLRISNPTYPNIIKSEEKPKTNTNTNIITYTDQIPNVTKLLYNPSMDIQAYMTRGVERIVSESIRATLKNPKESAFMLRFASASRKASVRRKEIGEQRNINIPPFLIASITSRCNLHCQGCYSRCNEATTDSAPEAQLTDEEWGRIFEEAESLGISFILLAGGEPLLRRDVLEQAAGRSNILFPVFTNGTYINDKYFDLFDNSRNILPVMSLEGGREVTDARRGPGIYDRLLKNMDEFKRRGIVFGASITVTTANYQEVTGGAFIEDLRDRGLKLVIYVEYVPDKGSNELAPTDTERAYMEDRLKSLRQTYEDIVLVSFPGDEKSSGGCIAAGRGFFHINSHGGAEPCPFSPYSDINARDNSLIECISSPLFAAIRSNGLLEEDHNGGCVLHNKSKQIERLKSELHP